MEKNNIDDRKFLAWLTMALIAASLWIFKSYLHYLLVAAVLGLATSHIYTALTKQCSKVKKTHFIYKQREIITASLLTIFFLLMIFGPLLYFVSVTFDQVSSLNIAQIKITMTEIVDKSSALLEKVSFLQEPLARIKQEGINFVKGPALDAAFDGAKGLVVSAGGLLGQITWILLFYFLFNAYGKKLLNFIADLIPMTDEHKHYLYRECAGTVSVVFYGTLFNMVAQGLAFGLLMIFIGDYDAFYLGVLAGFCSIVPIVGAALVYVPILALELLAGNVLSAIVVLIFAWVIMGFLIDNILRLIFIGFLKKMFGFEYTMNEILILLAILAGIASFGIWGLIIGPSVLALTFAAANLYSSGIKQGQ